MTAKKDYLVDRVRRYLEPGPIVLVSSRWQTAAFRPRDGTVKKTNYRSWRRSGFRGRGAEGVRPSSQGMAQFSPRMEGRRIRRAAL
jgi:hypothetical protein